MRFDGEHAHDYLISDITPNFVKMKRQRFLDYVKMDSIWHLSKESEKYSVKAYQCDGNQNFKGFLVTAECDFSIA